MGVVSTAGPAMNILGLFLAFTILQTAYSEPLHDVWCGKYTTRHIDVGFNETSTITSTKDTGRCKVVYDMAAAGANCTKMEFTCGRFFLRERERRRLAGESESEEDVGEYSPLTALWR